MNKEDIVSQQVSGLDVRNVRMLESIIMSHQWLFQEQGLIEAIRFMWIIEYQLVSGQQLDCHEKKNQLSIMQKIEKITMEKKGDTFIQIVTIYYINLSISLFESLSPNT